MDSDVIISTADLPNRLNRRSPVKGLAGGAAAASLGIASQR